MTIFEIFSYKLVIAVEVRGNVVLFYFCPIKTGTIYCNSN